MRHTPRLLAAGILATVLAVSSTGCAKESATVRFCNKFDEATHLIDSIDFEAKDPNSIKIYTKAVDDIIAATDSAPPAIQNDVATVRSTATETANQVLNAETPDRAQAKLQAVAFIPEMPATKKVEAYMAENCGFDSTGPSS